MLLLTESDLSERDVVGLGKRRTNYICRTYWQPKKVFGISGKQSWDTNRELSGLPQLNLN